VNGIVEIRSTSSEGVCSIVVDLEKDESERASVVTDIRNAVLSVDLPDEIRETPRIREFKSSMKAIINIAMYLEDKEFLRDVDRKKLQNYVHSLENRLLALAEVNSVDKTGYLKEELQVLLDPEKLSRNRLPVHRINASHLSQFQNGFLGGYGDPLYFRVHTYSGGDTWLRCQQHDTGRGYHCHGYDR